MFTNMHDRRERAHTHTRSVNSKHVVSRQSEAFSHWAIGDRGKTSSIILILEN